MNCEVIKKMIPLYQTGELENGQIQEFLGHVRECPGCSQELKAYEAAWHMLGKWEDRDPDPGYISRFWTNLSFKTPWYERIWKTALPVLVPQRLVPILATFVMAVILVQMTFSYMRIRETERLMTTLSGEEIEFIENIEIAKDLDVLVEMDLLQDFDIIAGGVS
jgi:hypothetical protein